MRTVLHCTEFFAGWLYHTTFVTVEVDGDRLELHCEARFGACGNGGCLIHCVCSLENKNVANCYAETFYYKP